VVLGVGVGSSAAAAVLPRGRDGRDEDGRGHRGGGAAGEPPEPSVERGFVDGWTGHGVSSQGG
jgi:hypothetical protein